MDGGEHIPAGSGREALVLPSGGSTGWAKPLALFAATSPPPRGGIRWMPVGHAGNAIEIPEEADATAELRGKLVVPTAEAR